MNTVLHVGLIGCGAIGSAIISMLRDDSNVRISGVLRLGSGTNDANIPVVHRVEDFAPSIWLVVEAAGVEAVRAHGVAVLRSGRNLAILSTAACVDDELLSQLQQAAHDAERNVVALCGAIGGLDALCAARIAGLTSVRYIGRKPPAAWRGSAASKQINLDRVESATRIFEGTAREAVTLYPQNANVAATLALAGIGFDRTEVTLIADPGIERNIHSFEAESAAGRVRFETEGYATAANPKTSATTALGVVSFLRSGVGIVPIQAIVNRNGGMP